MKQEIGAYNGIYYFDFDTGIIVAHKWEQSFSIQIRGFTESCSVTRHTILTNEEIVKEKNKSSY